MSNFGVKSKNPYELNIRYTQKYVCVKHVNSREAGQHVTF